MSLTPRQTNKHRLNLLKLLNQHFNVEELRDLCFALHIDHEQLPATKSSMVREFIEYCERHGRLLDLVQTARDFRPDVAWPQINTTKPEQPQPPQIVRPGEIEPDSDLLLQLLDGLAGKEEMHRQLTDDDHGVRVRVVQDAPWGRETAVAICREMLKDPMPQVRVAAIQRLEALHSDADHAWRKHLVFECYVPAGAFTMGEAADSGNASPMHEVFVDAFYISRYLVTAAEYSQFESRSVPNGHAHWPITKVEWYDARKYAEWARMQLPTEAQWEKAAIWNAQTGTKNRYPWGEAPHVSRANIREAKIFQPTPVGHYSPDGDSPCGAADMIGNVWEWCSSSFESYPYEVERAERTNITDPRRVVRGGDHNTSLGAARGTRRRRAHPKYKGDDIGIRLVWAVDVVGK